MAPLNRPLALYGGDTFDLTFRLYQQALGGALTPFVLAAGEALELRFAWDTGEVVVSTAGSGDGLLTLVSDQNGSYVARRLHAFETASMLGKAPVWSFARLFGDGERRTYVAGAVNVAPPPNVAPNMAFADVTITDGGATFDVTAGDVFSYLDTHLAIERVRLLGGASTLGDTLGKLEARIAALEARGS